MVIKYCSLRYSTPNIGDEIQSLAFERFLPRVDERLDRDFLNDVPDEGEKRILIMNGWFTHRPQNWPPSAAIKPIFIGFHITYHHDCMSYLLAEQSIEYFKQHEPIGCRDSATRDMLNKKGVDAYYSKCATLTFPKRDFSPRRGRVFIVNGREYTPKIPAALKSGAIRISHDVPIVYGPAIKFAIAKRFLALYRNNADLVITTKLHCALPCIAYGIPVIFFGESNDYRLSILTDLGLSIYGRDAGTADVDWAPEALDIDEEKAVLIDLINGKLKAVEGG